MSVIWNRQVPKYAIMNICCPKVVKAKVKDPSGILPGDLHHGNGKDHGCKRIQEACGHIPYNVTFFRIFRFFTYDQPRY